MFRQSLRDFFAAEVIPNLDAWEEARELPRDIWKKCGDQGMFGLMYPEQYGGMDEDFFYSVVLLEELARVGSGGFGAAMGTHPYLSMTHIHSAGSEALKEKYLIPGIKGEKFGCLAISEPFGGSDVAALRTKAVRDGDHFIVNGSKTFITNGVLSDYLVVAVKTDPDAGGKGISMLVIDRDSPGLQATKLKKLGWHSSDTAEISFDDVKVPVSNLIGQENAGFFYIMQHFALERLIMAISAVEGSAWAIETALKYMSEREAFGRPINRFQVLRHRVAEMASEIEKNRYFTYHICKRFNDGEYVVKEAAMAKLLTTDMADKVMYNCLQFFGGYGFMEEYPMARAFRDSRIGPIGGGTNEIMCEIISKMVIDDKQYAKV